MHLLKSVDPCTSVSLHPVLECAGRIVSLTVTGELDASSRLGEGSLTSLLSASRATVRSALDHLELSGLVTRVPRAGTYLRAVGPQEFCQVMDIRAALEALSVRLATSRAHEDDLKALSEAAEVVDDLNRRRLGGDRSVFGEASQKDLRFHLAIAHLSGNPDLVSTLAQKHLIEDSYRLPDRGMVIRPQHDRPVPTHREIVEAIAGRDPTFAEAVMRRHILRTKEMRLGTITGEVA